jgi:hypothetical protein
MGSASDERSFRKVALNDTYPGRFFQNNFGLTSPPTNLEWQANLGVDDYRRNKQKGRTIE